MAADDPPASQPPPAARDEPRASAAVDVNAVARAAIRRAKLDGDAQVSLRAALFDSLPPVEGSHEQLTRALCELLRCARRSVAGLEGGAIEIETEPDGDLVAIRILDNGRGMSEGELEQLFDPFVSERKSFDARGGSGPEGAFDVSDAWKIVRDHRGRLLVRSRPGEGSCFVALLPTRRG